MSLLFFCRKFFVQFSGSVHLSSVYTDYSVSIVSFLFCLLWSALIYSLSLCATPFLHRILHLTEEYVIAKLKFEVHIVATEKLHCAHYTLRYNITAVILVISPVTKPNERRYLWELSYVIILVKFKVGATCYVRCWKHSPKVDTKSYEKFNELF